MRGLMLHQLAAIALLGMGAAQPIARRGLDFDPYDPDPPRDLPRPGRNAQLAKRQALPVSEKPKGKRALRRARGKGKAK